MHSCLIQPLQCELWQLILLLRFFIVKRNIFRISQILCRQVVFCLPLLVDMESGNIPRIWAKFPSRLPLSDTITSSRTYLNFKYDQSARNGRYRSGSMRSKFA